MQIVEISDLQDLSHIQTTDPLRIPQKISLSLLKSSNEGSGNGQGPNIHLMNQSARQNYVPPKSQLQQYSQNHPHNQQSHNHRSSSEMDHLIKITKAQHSPQSSAFNQLQLRDQTPVQPNATIVSSQVTNPQTDDKQNLNISGAPNVTKRRREIDIVIPQDLTSKTSQPPSQQPPAEEQAHLSEPQTSRSERNVGHYSLFPQAIGEGTFGKVKLGKHILTGEKVAVKILEKDRISDMADVERVAREIHILKLIRHPNIIQLYEIIETERQLYLIMEYASGGELFDYIVTKGRVKEPEACRYFQQIVDGVEYLHSLNIVHRDLKPENLLLDSNKNIKIVDFGLSNTFKKGETLITACGSPCYAAPEMIAGLPYLGARVDTWSCGVIMFALICGYLPFEDPITTNLYQKILKGEFQIPRFVSKEAAELIKGILSTDPQKRYTLPQIRIHPWLNQIPHTIKRGVDLEQNQIEISSQLIDLLENKYQFKRDHAEKSILNNKHNHVTTTYYLLQQKFERLNGDPALTNVEPPAIVSAPTDIPKPTQQQQLPQQQQEQPDTFEYKDQPLDEERGANVDMAAAIVYSPRERVAPGMVSKNKGGESSKGGVGSNKLEPSANQMEIELVVNSARSQNHKKNVSQTEVKNSQKVASKQKKVESSTSPVQRSIKDNEETKSRQPNQVFLDNSRSEQQAGINVSYENSLSVIRRDIKRETLDKKVTLLLPSNATQKPPKLAISIQFDPIEEKPSNQSTNRSNLQQTKKSITLQNGNKVMNEYLSKPSPKNSTAPPPQIKIGDRSSNIMNLLRPKTQTNKKVSSTSASGQHHNQSYNSNDSHKTAQSPAQNCNASKQLSVDAQDQATNKIGRYNTNSINLHKKGKGSNISTQQIINQTLINNSGQLTPKTNQSNFQTTSGALKLVSQSYQTAPANMKQMGGGSSVQTSQLKSTLKPQINLTSLSLNSAKGDKNSTLKNVKTTQVSISTNQQIPKPPNQVNILMAKNYLSSTPKSKANQLFLMNSIQLTSKAIHQQQLSKSPGRINAESARTAQEKEKQQPSVQTQLQKLLLNGLQSPIGGSTNPKMFDIVPPQSQRAQGGARISTGKVLGPKLINSQQLDQHTTSTSMKESSNKNSNAQQQGGMRVSKGAFNLSCSTMRQPQELLKTINELLPSLGISFKQLPGTYIMICSKGNQTFEMEITRYEQTDFLYIVKFKKLQSPLTSSRYLNNSSLGEHVKEDTEFRRLSEQVLNGLNL